MCQRDMRSLGVRKGAADELTFELRSGRINRKLVGKGNRESFPRQKNSRCAEPEPSWGCGGG